MGELAIEFCGEWFRPSPDAPFDIGREGDLAIDDNLYLHRRFLRVTCDGDIWWLTNTGSNIAATVSDARGGVQSWLPPGHRLPIVLPHTAIVFTAGPTTYELTATLTDAPYYEVHPDDDPGSGDTTIGAVQFTVSQRQLIVALAEPMLRREGTGLSEIPSSADAARRLGWTTTRFNRKLDNVCDKLDRIGVKGLRGGPGGAATNRRARLVEHAVTSRLVTPQDLPLLDQKDDA